MTEVIADPFNNAAWLKHIEVKKAEREQELKVAVAQLAVSLADKDGSAQIIPERLNAIGNDHKDPLELLGDSEKAYVPAARVVIASLVEVFEFRRLY